MDPNTTGARNVLVAAIRRRDERALRAFYDAHFPSLYRYVLARMDGDHPQAEEVVADVFFQAFRDIDKYDGRSAPRTWLLAIARHRVLDAYRRLKKRPVVELVFSRFDEDFTRRLFDLEAAELPEDQLERTELAKVVELVLSELPPEYEQVLRMRYLDDRPVKDLAGRLEITLKAAEGRLYRARIAFRDAFKFAARNLVFEA